MSLIVFAIPVFFLLIGLELLIGKMRQLSYYRYHDSITNLSCGIGSQVAGIFLKTATIFGYKYLFEHYALFTIPTNAFTFLLLFIGVDFFYYWFHRLAHEISLLWGSHVVHHQSEEYNLTVALRQAWLQGAFSWVFYLPLAVIGFSTESFILMASINTLYQFWIHTKMIDKMWGPFEYVFNTPSHHRVHHGVNPQYIDKNHGGTMIIWDRLFNTFEPEQEEVVYGITTQPKSWNPIWLNFEYWIDLIKDSLRVSKISDAIKMYIKMPGWKPKELGGMLDYPAVNVKTFHKYDTEISSGLNNYVFAQFVVVLLATTAFLILMGGKAVTDHFALKAAIGTWIIASLTSFGAIFEKRKWALPLEPLRLLAGIVLITAAVTGLEHFTELSIIAAVTAYCVASLFWFMAFRTEFADTATAPVAAQNTVEVP
ncbi:MAG: sterol desaturase family protein [Chitinophagales bacterium]